MHVHFSNIKNNNENENQKKKVFSQLIAKNIPINDSYSDYMQKRLSFAF